MPDFDVFIDDSFGSTVHGVVDAEAAIAEQRRRMGWREDMTYKLTTLPAWDSDSGLPPTVTLTQRSSAPRLQKPGRFHSWAA